MPGNAPRHLLAPLAPTCLWDAGTRGVCGEAGNSKQTRRAARALEMGCSEPLGKPLRGGQMDESRLLVPYVTPPLLGALSLGVPHGANHAARAHQPAPEASIPSLQIAQFNFHLHSPFFMSFTLS